MDEPDLDPAVLRARAARAGRELDATELAELTGAVRRGEVLFEELRQRPIGLLSGTTDHAHGDSWIRPGGHVGHPVGEAR